MVRSVEAENSLRKKWCRRNRIRTNRCAMRQTGLFRTIYAIVTKVNMPS